MLRQCFWGCLSLSISPVCFADSVQLYGLIDQGVRFNFQKATPSQDGVEIKHGNKMGSRFGLKGREEITPAHSVFFNLEGDIYASSASPIMKKRRLIGYEHRAMGQWTLGLQSSVSLDIARLFDPAGMIRQKYVVDDLTGSFNGKFGNKWIDKALKYSFRSPQLQLITSYQFADFESNTTPNFAFGSSYQIGKTLVAGSYSMTQNKRFTQGLGAARILNAGVAHQVGKVHLKMGVSHSQLSPIPLGSSAKFRTNPISNIQNLGLGLKYQALAHIDVFAAAYRQKISTFGAHNMYGNKFVIGGNYQLSKRTHIYAFIQHANGSDSAKYIRDLSSGTMGVVHKF